MNITGLKIPTGGRQTSWLFASMYKHLQAYGDYKTQNRKPNNIQKTSLQRYKTQIKILLFPELTSSGTEQPGQGATVLGWP